MSDDFDFSKILKSVEDQREKRIDKILSHLLKAKKINQMTNIKRNEFVFYTQFNLYSEIMRFFQSNAIKNQKGNIKALPTKIPATMQEFMLGLSRSRDGWFVDNMFKYLRAEDYERREENTQIRKVDSEG